MRTEMRAGDPVSYATDATAVNSMASRLAVRAGSFVFAALDNPYCAMFVLDRMLAQEYAASDSFHLGASMSKVAWRAVERAAMGLCWEAPRPGFRARHVVPIDAATLRVASCAHVQHLLVYRLLNSFNNRRDSWPLPMLCVFC
jgi:hypothetical protein